MRQVPRYAIIGNGRASNHFRRYFDFLGVSYFLWFRDLEIDSLKQMVHNSSYVLLLIDDSAICSFIKKHPFLENKILIHCSGNVTTESAYSVHPLMTFDEKTYDLKMYQSIPFVLDQNTVSFSMLFPDLPNPHFIIPRELKGFYHALCVLSGNFTTLLWQKIFSEFKNRFYFPREMLYPYLRQTFYNVKEGDALTGPLARQDNETMLANLEALSGDSYQKIYQAFIEVYRSEGDKNAN